MMTKVMVVDGGDGVIVFIAGMKVVMITMVTVVMTMLTVMATIVLMMVVVMVTTVMMLLVTTVKVIILIGPQGDAWIHFRSAFFSPLCPRVKCKRPPRGVFTEQNVQHWKRTVQ